MNEHIDKHHNSIPVTTCLRRFCCRQLTAEESKVGYCNAHQPTPELLSPDSEDIEALVYEMQVLTPLGWVAMAPDQLEPFCHYDIRWQVVQRMYGGIPDIYMAAPKDTCQKCQGWIHPDHWEMGVRECPQCTEKTAKARKKAEENEAVAQALGGANKRVRR